MLQLPDWLRPRSASVADLEAQLATARDLHATSVASVELAQAAFDDDGSDSALRALSKARDAATAAHEHVARAERLLDAARHAAEQRRREELAAERRRLETELSARAVDAALEPHVQRQADLLRELAHALEDTSELARTYAAKTARLRELRAFFGEPMEIRSDASGRAWLPESIPQHAERVASLQPVLALLAQELPGTGSALHPDTPLQAAKRALVDALSTLH